MTASPASIEITPAQQAALDTIDRIQRERLRRAQARVDEVDFERACRWREPRAFAAFVRLAWRVVEPRQLEWAPYMDLVCHTLHRQMLGDPDYRKVLINLPPGFAKSLLTSVLAPSYEWIFDPGRRKLFFSGDDSLSKRDSRKARQVLQSDIYRRLLTEVCRRDGRVPWEFAGDQNEKVNYENTDRGFRQCLTLRSGVTGKRGDDFVIDDPIDVKDVLLGGPDAIARRCAEANQIIDQALQTRVNDLRDARQTLIMQRLHPDDPAGTAIRDGDWRVVCLPLHYDPNHPQVCPDDPRTRPGELLHPNRNPERLVARLRAKLGQAQAEAQLEQRPSAATGGRYKREWFRERYTCQPEDLARTADEIWITSDTGRKRAVDSDFSVIHCWCRTHNPTPRRHMLDRRAERLDYPEYEAMMDGMIAKWAPFIRERGGGALIEDTANGTTYMQCRGSSYLGVPLIAFRPNRDTPGTDKSKGARSTYYERAAESGEIILPDPAIAPWVEDHLLWVVAFPQGAHDDDVDTASQLHMRWTLYGGGGDWTDVDMAV